MTRTMKEIDFHLSQKVLLDHKNIQDLNIQWYRSHIGYVGQEPILFTGSLEENIRLGKPDATEVNNSFCFEEYFSLTEID